MREYPARPLVGIGIAVLRDDKVLLIRRGRPPALGAWSLPGGAQELGETAEAAARRELLEETGLSAGSLTLIAHVDSIHKDEAGTIQYHYTILDFATRSFTGTAVAGGDVTALAWAAPSDLAAYNLWTEVHRVITAAMSRLPP